MTTTTIELAAPAGSPEALDAAIGEGADAVYLGLKDFNAHLRCANFSYSQYEAALRSLHRMGRRLYVTVNTVFEQREADRVYQLLKYLAKTGPDAIIVQDLGIAAMAQACFPSLKLFASSRINAASARAVNLLSRNGFSRVTLARELSLEEIRSIRTNTNMELEVFVHGSLCMSVSGLCLFSSYLGGKSDNRGLCTQACRRAYFSGTAGEDTNKEDGAYYFSPSDLQLVEKIPDLFRAGVNFFKIEGRMKSAEYVGTAVSAYRLVMDNLDAGEEALTRAIAEARNILKNDFARPKTVYLINGTESSPAATDGEEAVLDWLNPKQNAGTGIPLGKLLRVTGRDEESKGLLSPGGVSLAAGDSIRLHRARGSGGGAAPDRLSHKLTFAEDAPNGGCWISVPPGFGPGDTVYLIQTRATGRRYAPVITRGLKDSSRGPGRDKAPPPQEKADITGSRNRSRNKDAADFPPGFYVKVSRIEDLYIVQSVRPVKAILPYSRKLSRRLLGGQEKPLPFPARDIILSLAPFFPQENEAQTAADIPALIEKGYTRFIINNLAQFSLFRGGAFRAGEDGKNRPLLAAGPWLYTYNAWAWDFIAKCGAEYCVSPLENNRQNLERCFPQAEYFAGRKTKSRCGAGARSRVFVTIFSRPGLFHMRPNLGRLYDFTNFYDSRGEAFKLSPSPEGSFVYPQTPFSIVDKTPFLREAGFSRFILDFSSGALKKTEYREIMEMADRAAPLSGTSRFNWKNGFFRLPDARE